MTKNVTNHAASVRQRLVNLARQRNEDFGLLLTKYALERLLFRISQSEYQKIFVLKGALLFELWTEQTHRPTRDADFLSNGDNDPSRFETIFKEICALSVDEDGLQFDPASVKAQRIKEDADYEGVRVTFLSYLERARIPMQIDIGFGDTITPPPVETSFPTILNGPALLLLAYPKETVVAEKFEAMVKLGMANSRMKDFHDLRALSELFSFDGQLLAEAIVRTFERRRTAIPTVAEPPRAFTAEFFEDESKQRQWGAFNTKMLRALEGFVQNAGATSANGFWMATMSLVNWTANVILPMFALTQLVAMALHMGGVVSEIYPGSAWIRKFVAAIAALSVSGIMRLAEAMVTQAHGVGG